MIPTPTPHPTLYRRSHHRAYTIGSAPAMNMPLPPPYSAHQTVAPLPQPYPVVAPPHPSMIPPGHMTPGVQFPPQAQMGYAPQMQAPPQYYPPTQQPIHQHSQSHRRRESYDYVPRESHERGRREHHDHIRHESHGHVHHESHRRHESRDHDAHRGRDSRDESHRRRESRVRGHSITRPRMVTGENLPFPIDDTPVHPRRGRSHSRVRRVSFSHQPIIPGVTVPAPAPVVSSGSCGHHHSTSRRLAPAPLPIESYPQHLRRMSQPAPLGNTTNAFAGREWIHVSELGWLEGVYGSNKLRKSRRV
ncbi:hypothetical protein AURDEDRAFT_119177 [Auricularia subglabra TFB-10046 SS5]|nr:hypothetical protein AURDEDRAFT_119177 [Auricularia subglabra TFB-10046 SS5]